MTFLWWLVSRFLALPAAASFVVLFIYYRLLGEYTKTATDIFAARVHNLASFLEVFIFLLILALYVYRVEKSNEYPDFSDYFRDKKFLCGIAALFAVLFSLYVGGLSQWLRGENVHKRAKLYFVAGETLNSFRRLLPGHPDDWEKLPLNVLQKIIFNRAARLIPDDDGETAAWEYRWFWTLCSLPGSSRYTSFLVRAQGMPDYQDRNPRVRAVLDKRWRWVEDMDAKPIRDPKVRRELYMLQYHSVASAVYAGIVVLPKNDSGNSDENYRIHRMTFEEYDLKLAPRLVRLVEEWQRTPENRALIAEHPKVEAQGLLTLTHTLQSVMQSEIRVGTFRCENDSVQQYLATRRQFFAPETGKAAYLRVEDRKWLHTSATERQLFAQYVLEQSCGLKVPGRIAPQNCQLREDGKEATPEQCLEEQARKYLDKELQLILDKLPLRAPDEAAEQPETLPANAVSEE